MLSRLGSRPSRERLRALALVSLACAAGSCGGTTPNPPADSARTVAAPADTADAPLPPPAYEAGLPEDLRTHLFEPVHR